MLNKWIFPIGILFFAPAFAQDVETQPAEDLNPLPAPTSSEKPGEVVDISQIITDTDAQRILGEKRDTKRSVYKSEEIFLTPNSSKVMDLQNLGVDRANLEFFQTNVGVISRSEKDSSGGERIFSGRNTGTTQVLVFEKGPEPMKGKLLKVYKVVVSKEDLVALLQEIKALIGQIEGLELRVVGEQVVLDGQILIPTDMRRILEVVDKYKNRPIMNLTELSPVGLKLIAEKMEEEIAGGKDKPKDIQVKVLNGRFFLEGIVDKVSERQTAIRICKAYVQPIYIMNARLPMPDFSQGEDKDDPVRECNSLIRIRAGQPQQPDPIVAVRVDFVTLTKNYAKAFNFKWAPGVNMEGSANYSTDLGKFTTSFVATLSSLFPTLDNLATHGHARILKSATLLVRDGASATSGDGAPPASELSETLTLFVPKPASKDAEGNDVPAGFERIDVNTQIGMLIKSLAGSDKLNLDINVNQTEVQENKGPEGVATLNNKIKTSIVLGNGESAALGGLISERRNVDIVRDPAKEAGVSFNLFEVGRGHSFNDSKSQFIVFVTPTKMRTPAEGTEVLKRKFRLRK